MVVAFEISPRPALVSSPVVEEPGPNSRRSQFGSLVFVSGTLLSLVAGPSVIVMNELPVGVGVVTA